MSQAATAQGEKLLYTGRVHTQGGRDHGIAHSDHGQLEVKFSPPGSGRPGTNPEQMLAAGRSACFEGALDIVARKRKVTLASDPTIDAEVGLNYGGDGFFLRAPQRKPTGRRAGCRAGPGRGSAPDLPLFQGTEQKHRRDRQPGLTQLWAPATGARSGSQPALRRCFPPAIAFCPSSEYACCTIVQQAYSRSPDAV